MEYTLYWIGGITTALFVIRLILMLVGFDGAADAADAGSAVDTLDAGHMAADAADFKVFSLMTLLVTVMMGSWIALGFLELQLPAWVAIGGGYGIGFGGGVATSYALFSMRKLESDGTVRTEDAVGLKGTVYVKIPEAGKGKGQIQVTVKGRLRTFDAVSDGPEIASFKTVAVMSKVENNLLRVCPSE
ncbi:MAG: hypothetical protein HS108_13665 [Planctomycetes bacterium]|jgi:hypothetical protein|nr:hypothetical protein [Planctomycetota bacterium]MCL4729128.1 hypothetical protein [Planctomycetota bacterium]